MEVVQAGTEEQLSDAYNVRKKVFVEEQHVPENIEIDENENSSTHFVLYNDDGQPIGAGRFRIVEGKGKVERICVLPEYRGLGAGVHIMQKIEEHAKKLPIEELVLNSQSYAVPFYEKIGYQTISDEFMDAGIPHRAMAKKISK